MIQDANSDAAIKILCIDDDPEISRAIELRLRRFDVVFSRAFHGMQGFWMAMTERPNLIITDINMPQGHGDYVVECLRRNTETNAIPIIVLSGMRDPETQRRMQGLGVNAWLAKPCSSEELIEKINAIVELPILSESDGDVAHA